MQPKTSHFAVLGWLANMPLTGYEIKQRIEQSISFFWQESFGSIYPHLHEMEEVGWVEVSESKRNGRLRKVYNITRQGRKALHQWLQAPHREEVFKNELLLKLFFGVHTAPQALLELLKIQRKRVHEAAETYRRISEHVSAIHGDSPATPYQLLTLEYGLKGAEAELQWLQRAEEVIRAQYERASGTVSPWDEKDVT
ncbi:PadR family transcriptional regulator [bacterium]|nr:PadR family transcriptional regulator [bacterium]